MYLDHPNKRARTDDGEVVSVQLGDKVYTKYMEEWECLLEDYTFEWGDSLKDVAYSGQETMHGVLCDVFEKEEDECAYASTEEEKAECEASDAEKKSVRTRYFQDASSGYPVVRQNIFTHDKMTLELVIHEFKLGGVDDALFEVPEGIECRADDMPFDFGDEEDLDFEDDFEEEGEFDDGDAEDDGSFDDDAEEEDEDEDEDENEEEEDDD